MSERNYSDDADTNDGRVTVWALQDLKESLDAIAEQLRIANLIALAQPVELPGGGEASYGIYEFERNDSGDLTLCELRPEIREALGIRE